MKHTMKENNHLPIRDPRRVVKLFSTSSGL